MVLRTARKGRNAGGQFWGCSDYPTCKGTGDASEVDVAADEHVSASEVQPRRRMRRRVEWRDGTLQRDGWVARYTHGGGSLRSIDVPAGLLRRFGACWIAREDVESYRPADPGTRRVIALVRKILQRGSTPPLHPAAEQELLEAHDFGDRIRPSLLPGDLAPRLEPGETVPLGAETTGWDHDAPVTRHDLPYDSHEEREFHQEWVPNTLGAEWARWFVPQASLDLLLAAAGIAGEGMRRVDFLVSAPWCDSFVVEIDGAHEGQEDVDEARDEALAEAGYDVIRVTSAELRNGSAASLTEIQRRCPPAPKGPGDTVLDMVHAAAQGHRLLLALLEALAAGFVAGDRWAVDVRDTTGWSVAMAAPYLDLFAAAALLWGDPSLAPNHIEFCGDDDASFELVDGVYIETETGAASPADVTIHLESSATPVEDLPARNAKTPQIVVRSAHLPLDVRDVPSEGSMRVPVNSDPEATRRAMGVMLRSVFAKSEFRDGQLEAILELLAGRDCVVLLPTGAGKSLIYQLAGLCMPGRTLVIDPLVALIEDQVLGLHRNGIDRVAWITGDRVQEQGTDALLESVEAADALFVLVSPERLQTERFRQSLAMLAIQTPVNLAVVDEAHCVSEWGHQFRTSYLNLGATIAKTCSDQNNNRPPVVALTGTASRAVLRDVLHELAIDERTPNSIVRPQSFDRPELHYRVVTTDPSTAPAILQASIRSLPDEFNQQGATFFSPRKYQTSSGVVFCQVVNGKRGVLDVAKNLAPVVGGTPVVFSGSPPKGYDRRRWSGVKADSAQRFKANEAPVLVSTSAFGMGIDKPNIRWVVHYGLPGSIEAYYQEVGRAGRDGRQAHCVLVYSEYDEQRARALLSEDLDLEDARDQCNQITSWAERDDVTSALFFHFNSFPGTASEVDELSETAALIDPERIARAREIPFGPDDDARERALHRLVVLGVVRDYLVDWGSKKFTVHTAAVEPADIQRALLTFVERSQPGRVEALRLELDELDLRKLSETIEVCGRMLVSFVYETIERSRRRSLREMWVAAKEARTDAELRQRVLDYLSEGDVAPILERLAEEQRFDLAAWRDAWARLTSVDDAREWRGTTARLLASYPDQPGLLVGRAIAELVDPDGDIEDFDANLEAAITSAPRYGIGDTDSESLLEWVLAYSARRSGRAFAAALAKVYQLRPTTGIVERAIAGPGSRHRETAGVAVTELRLRLDHELTEVDELLRLVGGRY